jgi:hypothetical protein
MSHIIFQLLQRTSFLQIARILTSAAMCSIVLELGY